MKMNAITFLRKSKKVNRSRFGTAFLFIVLLVFASFTAMPLVLMVGNSLKPLNELWIFPPRLFPRSPTFKNYLDMFRIMNESWVPFLRYLWNTVFITAAGTFGHIIFASMCAFPLAKRNFPGKNLIFNTIVLALMFNATVTAVPNYITMSVLHWIDTPLSLIIPSFSAALGLYLMKQFMEQLPDSLLEAARIDGASQWRTFWDIVMPNVKPAWLTLMLLSVQGLWNIGATSYIFSEELKTLSYALSQIMAGGIARAGVGAAVAVFMMLVPVGIFIFSQSNIIRTMASSGMKE
ncbi:MAG: carbohydrate ABC transporter permease [Eubacteriales bacterium]|nr:carbohydrate ABC transporter permease [Eubacteriales bacterium]MDD4326784.1 carbohydrate ABC transporter permease [Eubacteriales bacterium]